MGVWEEETELVGGRSGFRGVGHSGLFCNIVWGFVSRGRRGEPSHGGSEEE